MEEYIEIWDISPELDLQHRCQSVMLLVGNNVERVTDELLAQYSISREQFQLFLKANENLSNL
jgi:hypothetical protein